MGLFYIINNNKNDDIGRVCKTEGDSEKGIKEERECVCVWVGGCLGTKVRQIAMERKKRHTYNSIPPEVTCSSISAISPVQRLLLSTQANNYRSGARPIWQPWQSAERTEWHAL